MESDKNQEKSFGQNRQKGRKMNKTEVLEEYKNQEQRLLAAKILDRLEFSKTKNKIQSTDFLNLNEQELAMKLLKKVDYENYYFFGGKENTERKILIIYPEKYEKTEPLENTIKKYLKEWKEEIKKYTSPFSILSFFNSLRPVRSMRTGRFRDHTQLLSLMCNA